MSSPLTRRDFVGRSVAGAATLSLGFGLRPLFANDVKKLEEVGAPQPGRIGDYKISLAEWSLHKRYFATEDPSKANLGFPKDSREEFGIEGIEFVNQFFKDKATDESYLQELKKRADDQGVECLLIMIDGEGSLSDPNNAKRTEAVENHKKWVDAAKMLGCHSIRVNTGNNYSAGSTATAAEGCSKLSAYAKTVGLNIICENHGGPSSDPDALLALIDAVGMDNFGTLPDFGNFPMNGPRQDRDYAIDIYAATARMMPFAKGVSAKCYDFKPDGTETVIDFARMMKIVTDAGYNGFVGIEYEGGRLSEAEGILAAKELLEALRGTLYRS